MFEFKLQFGCLIIILYITIAYIKNTTDKKIPCNRFFDLLLVIAPWAVLWDGLTAYTVNHPDTISPILNLIFHCLFYLFMNGLLTSIYLYMINLTIGIANRKQLLRSIAPGLLFQILILLFINKTYYIQGDTTRYSYGPSVFVCYFSMVFHFLLILLIVYTKKKTMEKKKFTSITVFIHMSLLLLLLQVVFPEILISALVPLITILGIYMNFEDPSLRKLKIYNSDMIAGFATLVENRDNSTGGHILRTQGYVRILLDEMKQHPDYYRFVTKDYIQNVIEASPMHDIGKISTPDHILQKPGRLEPEEYEIMKQHAAIGGDIIQKTFAGLDHLEYLQIAYEMARFHHEKWDGTGYPDGLKGNDIPLHARIMSIADVFDAVSSKRCYRDAMPLDECFQIIEDGSKKAFDPRLTEIFLSNKDKILHYYEQTKHM